MQEITEIIEAVDSLFKRFAATDPDKELRHTVARNVKFFIADMTSINWLADRAVQANERFGDY